MLSFRAFLSAGALAAVPPSFWAGPPLSPQPAAPKATAGQTPSPQPVAAQGARTVCGLPAPEPARLPPAGSGPVVYLVVPCFQKQGGSSVVEPNTYLYYLEMKNHVSIPSASK